MISRKRFNTAQHVELRKDMDNLVHIVSSIIAFRDPYTASHQRRVAELARQIALEMGFSEWNAIGIYIAGMLHDIGKVSVPSEILSKPGKLTASEFDIIKQHSRLGYEIVSRISFPWPIPQMILQHHERLDGSGYPDGLRGKQILRESRVLGVADVVEAIASHRPYRPALGLDCALVEIKCYSGVLYDLDAVEACLGLLSGDSNGFTRIMNTAEGCEPAVLGAIA
jgi:putative nucleotidyltransferase with HDIG domain